MKHDNVPTSVHTFGGRTASPLHSQCQHVCASAMFHSTSLPPITGERGGCSVAFWPTNTMSNHKTVWIPWHQTDLVLHSSLETLPNHIWYSARHYQDNQTSDSDVQECFFLSVLLHLNNKNVTLLKLSCVMQSSLLTECGWNKNWALIGRLRLVTFAKAPTCLHLF